VGGGTTGHWSDAANWRVSGGSNTTPQAGDELVFAGAAQTATDNDLAAGTAFHSIEVEAAGFSIAGHAIALPNGADLALTTGSANISANVILGGELHAVVNPSCTLTMSGVLSESTPHAGGLDVSRGGTLVLSGAATYSGLTTCPISHNLVPE
jgi:hypothetical protein